MNKLLQSTAEIIVVAVLIGLFVAIFVAYCAMIPPGQF